MTETLRALLKAAPKEIIAGSYTTTDLLKLKVDAYNSMPGDGREPCSKCKSKGMIAMAENGALVMRECECRTRAKTKSRIYRSGLGELYERYSLSSYCTDTAKRREIMDKAVDYISGGKGWFYICGRSGSGKTHITCAIVRELIEAGMEARYMMWREDAPRLKATVNDAVYSERMKELTECRVLLIDDLWKGALSDADVNLTFELLNARYNAPSRLTIISTEWSLEAILKRDAAIGGRIYERSKGFCLQAPPENYRLGRGKEERE